MSASGIYDCVVIGAGIAGASVAYELSQDASVLDLRQSVPSRGRPFPFSRALLRGFATILW